MLSDTALSIRPMQPADIGGIVALLRRELAREQIDERRFIEQVLLDPNFRSEGALVAEDGEGLRGFVLAIARQVPSEGHFPDRGRGYITLFAVDAERRNTGIGAKLLGAAESFLLLQNNSEVWISTYSPGYFSPGVDVSAYSAGLEFLRKRGYEEVYRPISMEVPLGATQVPRWISVKEKQAVEAGVAFEDWKPELITPLLKFSKEEFGPDWERYVREASLAILDGAPKGRLFVAYEKGSGRVLGFSHFDGERFGPIGIAASERGRGLGHVLMFRTLQAQKDAGADRSYFMWSDDKTAERLYNVAGFREARRFAVLRKEL